MNELNINIIFITLYYVKLVELGWTVASRKVGTRELNIKINKDVTVPGKF